MVFRIILGCPEHFNHSPPKSPIKGTSNPFPFPKHWGKRGRYSFRLLRPIPLLPIAHPGYQWYLKNCHRICHNDFIDFLNPIVFGFVAPTAAKSAYGETAPSIPNHHWAKRPHEFPLSDFLNDHEHRSRLGQIPHKRPTDNRLVHHRPRVLSLLHTHKTHPRWLPYSRY